jgi:hypothetical protein
LLEILFKFLFIPEQRVLVYEGPSKVL